MNIINIPAADEDTIYLTMNDDEALIQNQDEEEKWSACYRILHYTTSIFFAEKEYIYYKYIYYIHII